MAKTEHPTVDEPESIQDLLAGCREFLKNNGMTSKENVRYAMWTHPRLPGMQFALSTAQEDTWPDDVAGFRLSSPAIEATLASEGIVTSFDTDDPLAAQDLKMALSEVWTPEVDIKELQEIAARMVLAMIMPYPNDGQK